MFKCRWCSKVLQLYVAPHNQTFKYSCMPHSSITSKSHKILRIFSKTKMNNHSLSLHRPPKASQTCFLTLQTNSKFYYKDLGKKSPRSIWKSITHYIIQSKLECLIKTNQPSSFYTTRRCYAECWGVGGGGMGVRGSQQSHSAGNAGN